MRKLVHIAILHWQVVQRLVQAILVIGPIASYSNSPPLCDQLRRARPQIRSAAIFFAPGNLPQRSQPIQFCRRDVGLVLDRRVVLQYNRRGRKTKCQIYSATQCSNIESSTPAATRTWADGALPNVAAPSSSARQQSAGPAALNDIRSMARASPPDIDSYGWANFCHARKNYSQRENYP